MDGIEILVNEHNNIKKMVDLVYRESIKIVNGKEVDVKFFEGFKEFASNYADKHHHGKEEKILFDIMLKKCGPLAETLIRNGMYVEHDLGRMYLRNLGEALKNYEDNIDEARLNIIVNAGSYVDLLKRHIDKEDDLVYTFARRTLSAEDMAIVNEKTVEFEDEAKVAGTQEKYLKLLEEMEKNYE